MKHFYAVIDTNVIVSALLTKGSIPEALMKMCYLGLITPVYCKEIIDEYQEVLHRPKFDFDEDVVKRTIDAIIKNGVNIDNKPLDVELIDPKDRCFFEVACESNKGNTTYLVTGNLKHFPKELFVLSPREMLNLYFSETDN